ncbi:MAG: hypothetical protein IIU69_05965, partial [Bacteroidaceae bacterium]|nr:hypothetical protein [Bacteroidaceae bacterium]
MIKRVSVAVFFFIACFQGFAAVNGVVNVEFKNIVRNMPDDWYATQEAEMVADSVLAYQFPSGGWAKNQNWHWPEIGMKAYERASVRQQIQSKSGIGSTFDNSATIQELQFLSKMY